MAVFMGGLRFAGKIFPFRVLKGASYVSSLALVGSPQLGTEYA